MALKEKVKVDSHGKPITVKCHPPFAAIESFNEDQEKVFYYLVGCTLEKELKDDVLEIIKGDN